MELFALTEDDITPDIVKICLEKKTAGKVDVLFEEMISSFNETCPDSTSYTADYKLEKNEHFSIDDFDQHHELRKALITPKGIATLDINDIGLDKIKALFIGSVDGDKIYIQKFDKSQVITTTNSFLFFDNTKTFAAPDHNGLTIGPKLTAIIEGKKILFRNFNNLRRIFNMDKYFRDATNSELDSFQQSEVFYCEDGFKLSDFDDTVIRRKVTLLNMSGVLQEHTIGTLQEAASELNHPLDIMKFENKDRIKLPNNKKDVKLLLSFLDSDIYISAINGVKYRSNSKTRLI
jgi:hypothetical protein